MSELYDVDKYIEELSALSTEFAKIYCEFVTDGMGELYTCILGGFGTAYFDHFETMSELEKKSICDKIEFGASSDDDLLSECVVTGFVESIVNRCIGNELLLNNILSSFGNNTKFYAMKYYEEG